MERKKRGRKNFPAIFAAKPRRYVWISSDLDCTVFLKGSLWAGLMPRTFRIWAIGGLKVKLLRDDDFEGLSV
jgi:hypothetical protein